MDIIVGFYLTVKAGNKQTLSKQFGPVSVPRNEAEQRPAWMVDTPDDGDPEWSLICRCSELSTAMYTYPVYILLPSSNWFRVWK